MRQIILLHGALGATDQMERLCKELGKKHFQTFMHNFSGHGKMPFGAGFGIDAFSEELKELVEKNSLDKPHVFGYSMGGYVALSLALKHPELLGKIITLGTKFLWDREIAEKEIKNLDPDLIEQKVPKFAEALKRRHGNDWPELLKKTAFMMKEMGEKNFLSAESVKGVQNKVLIGIGDRDQMVSLEETLDIFRNLPNAQMYMLPGTKHPIETANAAMLASIIDEFVEAEANPS
jgi:pimeloyl-ACP methyl ester carboxylesterase